MILADFVKQKKADKIIKEAFKILEQKTKHETQIENIMTFLEKSKIKKQR